jgi:hypothetical protein
VYSLGVIRSTHLSFRAHTTSLFAFPWEQFSLH